MFTGRSPVKVKVEDPVLVSGRTGTDKEIAAIAPIQKIISMYRVMVPSTAVGAVAGAMMPGGGTMASSLDAVGTAKCQLQVRS